MNEFFNNLFNEYSLKARLYPAVICSVPFVIIKAILIDKYIPNFTEKFLTFALAGVPIWAVLVYLLTQINRFISKTFFEDKNNFPTLQMLTPSSKKMSQQMRSKISEKVQSDFGLTLPNIHDEEIDPEETKTRIKEIVGFIINKVGSGKLLLQHNIEYGFIRNLIGGSVFAGIISLISIFIFHNILPNKVAYIFSIVLTIGYVLPVLFSQKIISNYSQEYAEKLFREYLGLI